MEKLKLQKIDESLLQEHSSLELSDKCYFFGEYSGRKGYSHSEMNQLIFNFKKPMDKKGKIDWHYKEKEIIKISQLLVSINGWSKLKDYTWIPMPPSKIKSDPTHDDRLLRVLLKIKDTEKKLDVREVSRPAKLP